MREYTRSRLVACGVAVLATGLSVLLRLALFRFLDIKDPYITFLPGVILAAYIGGLWPGFLATLLSALAADYFFTTPRFSLYMDNPADIYALALFVLVAAAFSAICESRLRSRRCTAASERRYAVTLASIGDAVIATDTEARVTFLNPAAEALTGWPLADADGRPLAEAFCIINERTRQRVEDPAAKVLRLGTVVGLANHTALVARDGRERPIDDCGAPIVDDRGRIAGVVLVFRDVTERRQAEKAEAFRRANERMELALRGSNVLIWDIEMPDGDLSHAQAYHVNAGEDFGYDPHAPAGVNPLEQLIHPDDRDSAREAALAYLAGETAEYENEVRHVRPKDGSVRTILVRGVAMRDATGKPFRFAGTGVDITDLRHAEEALRASEARFRALVQNSTDIISLFDAEATVLYHSPAMERLLGYRPQDRIGRNVFRDNIVHPDDLDDKRAFFDAIRNRPEAPVTAEFRLRHVDGSWRHIEAIGQNFLGDPGVAGIVTNYRDVTERKRAEADLRQAKEEWERTFDSVPDLIAILDGHHRVVRANQAMARRLGTTPQQCVGLPCYRVVHGTDAPPPFCPHAQTLSDLRLHTEEVHEDRLGGDFLVTTTPLMDEQGKFLGAVHVARDVTEHKRAQDALRASERRFRIFVDHATDAFFLHDDKSRVLDANRQACESMGYTRDELTEMHPSDFDPDLTSSMLEEIHRKHEAGELVMFRTRHRRKDGTVFPVEVRSQAFREGGRRLSVSLVRDISEQIRAEEAMSERTRLASLAADVGIALTGADTLPGILQPCTEALVRHLGAAFARIWTLNEAESVLEMQASAGMYTRTDGTFSRVPVGQQKLGLIAQQRRAYLTNDVLNDPLTTDPEWARREGMVASAGHPLMVQDRVVGVMVLFGASRFRK